MTGSNPKQHMSMPPGQFVRVYITSKRIHANFLLDIRKNFPNIYFTARWPVVRDISAEQTKPAALWIQDNVDDIIRSDIFACYAEEDDVLNGSIWESAVAWAHGKPIFLAGRNEGFKEWKFAPRTRSFETLDSALDAALDHIRYQKTEAEKILEVVQANHLQAQENHLQTQANYLQMMEAIKEVP